MPGHDFLAPEPLEMLMYETVALVSQVPGLAVGKRVQLQGLLAHVRGLVSVLDGSSSTMHVGQSGVYNLVKLLSTWLAVWLAGWLLHRAAAAAAAAAAATSTTSASSRPGPCCRAEWVGGCVAVITYCC